MTRQSLNERQQALKSSFCGAGTRSLLRQTEEEATPEAQRETLRRELGIDDDQLLTRLLTLNVDADTAAALSLVPLIEVAWSDDELQQNEGTVILQAAKSARLGREAYELLKHWMREQPSAELGTAWKAYVRALCQTLSDDERRKLREDTLGRAECVAEAAGGILGWGEKISAAERTALDSLGEAFA